MANISHLEVLSFISQQTERNQSNTHMNYVYAVLKRCYDQKIISFFPSDFVSVLA